MSKQKHEKKKKKILEGHKKVGSHFIPPIKQLLNMNSTSFINQMLPELIWIGLINDNMGYIEGTHLIKNIFTTFNHTELKQAKGNFAYASSYKGLTDDNKSVLLSKLNTLGVLDDIKTYLAPLILLYDEFPMKFIGLSSTIMSNEELLRNISSCVERHIDKYDTPGIVLNGAALLSRLVTKKIYFPSDMRLPDLNSVINKPESEEAQWAAGFIRATTISEFGISKIDDTWARYFWNRGYEISPCILSPEKDSDE